MGLTLAQNLARTSGFPVFSVDYHLAPYGRFPVALIQCLAGYVHLTRDLGFRGDQIIVGGDSNGAHLTLLLERFLRLEGSKIPSHAAQRQRGEPDFAAVLLLSPWVVATNDMMPQREENLKYDIVPRKYGDWGVEAMQFVNPSRKTGMKLDDPWISPLMRTVEEVAQMPPTYVANGQLEVLYEEGKRFAAKCKQAGLITRHHVTVSYISPSGPDQLMTHYFCACHDSHWNLMTFSAWLPAFPMPRRCMRTLRTGSRTTSLPRLVTNYRRAKQAL